jgi:ataxin-3
MEHQGPYFTAVDLAEIGRQLDAEERLSLDSTESQKEPGNFDDSGYFSVQVLSKALQIWGLELIPIGSQSIGNSDPL